MIESFRKDFKTSLYSSDSGYLSRNSSLSARGSNVPSLSNLVIYLKGARVKGDLIEKIPPGQMVSFTERKALTLMQKQKAAWEELTNSNVVRVYPSILHLTSSNYNPIPHWNAGTQMVALNFQTMDKYLELNSALFNKNGSCGYVLKPRHSNSQKKLLSIQVQSNHKMFSNFQVISGNQLQYGKSDSFCPLIELEILGHDLDSVKLRTRAIKSSGHIVLLWKENFEFELNYSYLDFIRYLT